MSSDRILLVIGSARAGGAEGQLVRLACELSERGHVVRVAFSETGGPLTSRLDRQGVAWTVARRKLLVQSDVMSRLAGLLVLCSVIVRFRPTVVMAWLPTAIWPAVLLGRLLSRARLVAGVRGDIEDDKLRWQGPLLRRAFAIADCVVVNSPHLTEVTARWGVAPDRVVLIPNGVELPDGTSDVSTAPPTGVVVANYRWYKGHDTLLRAIAQTSTDFVIRLCGEGDHSRLSRMTRELAIETKVAFVPDPADVVAELRAAQFAVHPSTQEGMSNAILEQLSWGLPVVATSVGGTPLLVDDGVNGFLVPAGDARAMAAAIDEVVSDPLLRMKQGSASRDRATLFGWRACTSNYEELFARLQDGR